MADNLHTCLHLGDRKQVVRTPQWLYQLLNAHFGPFDHDPCPDPRPEGCDGLDRKQPWGVRNYLNPPFKDLAPWVERAVHEYQQHQKRSVMLIPFRVNNHWFLQHLWERWPILPILREIRFEGYTKTFPAPMCVVLVGCTGDEATAVRGKVIFRPMDQANILKAEGQACSNCFQQRQQQELQKRQLEQTHPISSSSAAATDFAQATEAKSPSPPAKRRRYNRNRKSGYQMTPAHVRASHDAEACEAYLNATQCRSLDSAETHFEGCLMVPKGPL